LRRGGLGVGCRALSGEGRVSIGHLANPSAALRRACYTAERTRRCFLPLPPTGLASVLRVQVKNQTLDTCYLHGGGPFEIGRGPRRDAERCIVDDPMVSRNQLRLVELDGRQVVVENISQT